MTGIALSRRAIARRVAQDIVPGSVINLGIGMPELVGNFLRAEDGVIVHTENGVVGAGPIIEDSSLQDSDLINAGRKAVSLAIGGHFVDHADSFAMVRGGHLDVTVLGAFQVSSGGDLANWSTGVQGHAPSPGGAMDLAAGARQVFVMMDLFARDGSCRLVNECSYPLTAAGVVRMLYSELAVLRFLDGGLEVTDLVQGLGIDELSCRLGLPLRAPQSGIAVYQE